MIKERIRKDVMQNVLLANQSGCPFRDYSRFVIIVARCRAVSPRVGKRRAMFLAVERS